MHGTDGDGDGECDTDDACTDGGPITRHRLKIRNLDTPEGDDKLNYRGTIVVPVTPAIDPATNGVRFLLTDASDGVVLDATVPGGSGWKTNRRGITWSYRNPAGPEGITKVLITSRRKSPGTLGFSVAGKNGSYAVASSGLPVKGTVVIAETTGQCGETVFPACSFKKGESTLVCK